MDKELTIITEPDELIAWAETFDILLNPSIEDAEILLNYMEGHDYAIGIDYEGKMYRQDISEENGEVEPYQIDDVLSEVKDHLKGKALVSVAAGWNYDKYMEYVDSDVRVQFVMPNTPAMVGEGVLLFEDKNSLNDSEREEIMKLFSSTGIVVEMPSKLMGIGGAITGCGPAFADMYIEAYADAAVKYGIPRKEAYTLVSQTMLGSAKLQLETNEHPGVLKDNVCSPSGTTICGVAALEKAGFRSACIESIEAIMNKNN